MRFLDEYLNYFQDEFTVFRRSHGGNSSVGCLAELIKMRGAFVALCFMVFLSLNVCGAHIRYLRPISARPPLGVITSDHEALAIFASSSKYSNADFILNCVSMWNQNLAEYYTPLGRTFTMNYNGYSGRVMKNSFNPGDLYVTDAEIRDIYDIHSRSLLVNDAYNVSLLERESILLCDYSGLSRQLGEAETPQGSASARKLTGRDFSFTFMTRMERYADFHITFSNLNHKDLPLTLKAYVNGRFISEFIIENRYFQATLDDVYLKEGTNDISFEIDGEYSSAWVTGLSFSD
jgi:hypothetical protein